MNTNTAFGLMDLIVLGCGVYMLYAYYLLMFKNEIKKGVLLPQNQDPRKCKDFDGYRKYVGPKALACGIVAVISGGIGLYQDYVGPVNSILYEVFFVLFIVVIVWLIVGLKKGEKKFW